MDLDLRPKTFNFPSLRKMYNSQIFWSIWCWVVIYYVENSGRRINLFFCRLNHFTKTTHQRIWRFSENILVISSNHISVIHIYHVMINEKHCSVSAPWSLALLCSGRTSLNSRFFLNTAFGLLGYNSCWRLYF